MAAWMSSFDSVLSSLKICFGVSGSGDAKISASRMAFRSADGSLSSASCPSCPSSPSCLSCPSSPSCPSLSSIRVSDRMRRVGRTRPLVYANRAERARLEHPHELQANHLEEREERDDEAATMVDVREKLLEAHGFGLRQLREQLVDAHLHRNLLRRQQHSRPHLG